MKTLERAFRRLGVEGARRHVMCGEGVKQGAGGGGVGLAGGSAEGSDQGPRFSDASDCADVVVSSCDPHGSGAFVWSSSNSLSGGGSAMGPGSCPPANLIRVVMRLSTLG